MNIVSPIWFLWNILVLIFMHMYLNGRKLESVHKHYFYFYIHEFSFLFLTCGTSFRALSAHAT